jgi:pentapeptide MXKDX repeat protein
MTISRTNLLAASGVMLSLWITSAPVAFAQNAGAPDAGSQTTDSKGTVSHDAMSHDAMSKGAMSHDDAMGKGSDQTTK